MFHSPTTKKRLVPTSHLFHPPVCVFLQIVKISIKNSHIWSLKSKKKRKYGHKKLFTLKRGGNVWSSKCAKSVWKQVLQTNGNISGASSLFILVFWPDCPVFCSLELIKCETERVTWARLLVNARAHRACAFLPTAVVLIQFKEPSEYESANKKNRFCWFL